MNELIRATAEAGLGKTIYDVFFALGFVSVMTGLVIFGKKLGLTLKKTVCTVLIVYPIAVLWMFTMFWIASGFSAWGGNNIVRVFVYVPLIGLFASKVLDIEKNKMMSLLSFGPLLVHGISHFGCIFLGCCRGYPCSWGLYNPLFDDIRFPIQPIEALGAVAIVIYLLCRAKKRNYVPDGREYPIMLTMYGSSRFLFEFFRHNEKLFWEISNLALHALFMLIVGIIWLMVIQKKRKG